MKIISSLAFLIILSTVCFFMGVRYEESRGEIRIDTTYVQSSPRLVHLPVPSPIREILPSQEILVDVDTLWRTKIETVLSECESDSIKIRQYETEFSDSLLEGTLYASVFGILLDQQLEYTVNVPHIQKTVYRTPIRGLVGLEANALIPFSAPSFSILGGIRFSEYTILARGDALRREAGVSVLRTF